GPSETTVGVLTHEVPALSELNAIPCGSEPGDASLVREEAGTGLQQAEALLPPSRASEASPGSLVWLDLKGWWDEQFASDCS
ncbi:hypothetical protein, partial [Pseudomonas syringae]|uniref:hypothetical protein n=1 Tax=Pseudomonas syringae TaxID=317 RepID=UPI000A4AFBA3